MDNDSTSSGVRKTHMVFSSLSTDLEMAFKN